MQIKIIRRLLFLVLFVGLISSFLLACSDLAPGELTVKSITPAENSTLPANTNTVFKAELEYKIGTDFFNSTSQYQIDVYMSATGGSQIVLGHKIIPSQTNGNVTIEFGVSPTEIGTIAVVPYEICFWLMNNDESMVLDETKKYIYNKE